MSSYRYGYNGSGSFDTDENGRYDAATHAIIAENVSRSLQLDAQRSQLGPTSAQLRARALAHHASTNGHGS